MALDVFGNGKTAVKVNVGKYMDPASNLNGNYSISNPIARIATTATRTWTDNGTGGSGDAGLRRLHPAVRSHQQRWPTASAPPRPRHLRHGGANDRGHRPGPPDRVGRPSERLAVRRVGAAAAAAARLGGGRLLQAVAPELHGHRQPGRRVRRLHAVQHHRAVRFAAAQTAAATVGDALQRRPGEVRADQQQHHRRELRQAIPELQRHAAQRQRAAEQRADASGRHQHRQDR